MITDKTLESYINQLDIIDGSKVLPSDFDNNCLNHLVVYWIPKNQRFISETQIKETMELIESLNLYIKRNKVIKGECSQELLNKYKKDLFRTYYIKYVFFKYLLDPVISIDPVVIDLNIYKDYKERKSNIYSRGLYQKGLFQVVEIDTDNTVVFKRLEGNNNNLIRVVLEGFIIRYIKVGDILDCNLRQRRYFIYWEIEHLNGYYLDIAKEYLLAK